MVYYTFSLKVDLILKMTASMKIDYYFGLVTSVGRIVWVSAQG
jgi:hypothetical protein